MKAMILAAGLGTRLRPVTNSMPKALVEVDGKPLLQHALEHVKQNGIRDVIVNVHHFPEQILEFLKLNNNFGLEITISDESDELLETGGGVKKASWFFTGNEPFLVRNMDVISNLDIEKMRVFHQEHGSLATLAVRKRESSRHFLFDDRMQLCGWENSKTGIRRIIRESGSLARYAFNGIQILSTEIFPMMIESGKFSLTELYLRLGMLQPITGFPDEGESWYSASAADVT